MRYHWRSLFAGSVIMLLSLALAGCGGGGGSISLGPAPATVQGIVLDDATGQPISGATARSGGRSARTTPEGAFTLGVEVGIVSITVSKSHYNAGTVTANPTAGESVDLGTISLTNSDTAPPPPPLE